MKNERGHIRKKAMLLFLATGTRSATLNDIARSCSISKKQLADIYTNKNELVIDIVRNILIKNERHIRFGAFISPDAPTELIHFSYYLQQQATQATPRLIWELKKYHPGAYSLIEHFRTNHLLPGLRKNIQRGIAEGTYRKELDTDAICWLFIWQLKNAAEDAGFPLEKRTVLLDCFNDLFLHAIINPKCAAAHYKRISDKKSFHRQLGL